MESGLITRDEVLARGLSRFALHRKLKAGKWQELFPGVYLTSPQQPTFQERVLAGSRWASAVASYRTAATLFGFFESPLIELTTCRNVRSPRPEVVVHRVRSLNASDLTLIGPIRVTTPIRTLFDIAGVVQGETLRRAAYEAWRRDLITAERLRRALEKAKNGKPGIAELRRILKEGLDSYLEGMLKRVLDKSPLCNYTQEYQVRNSNGECFYIDFAFPNENLAVEADGWAHHSDREAFQRDRYKWRELAKLGWTTLPFTYEDIKFRPKEVVATITAALSMKRNA